MTTQTGPCRRTIRYSGTVQGVGFRYTTERTAHRFSITGYVKNLADGDVECVVEGPRQEIVEFMRTLGDAMAGYVQDAPFEDTRATGEFPDFRIRL